MGSGFETLEQAKVAQQRARRPDEALPDPKRRYGVTVDQHHGMLRREDAGGHGTRGSGADDQHVRGDGRRQIHLLTRSAQDGGSWGKRPKRSTNPVSGRARGGAPATMPLTGGAGCGGGLWPSLT